MTAAAKKNRTSAPRRCLLISTGRCAEYLSEKGGKWSATAEPGWERESTLVVGEVGHPQRYWRGGRRKWEMGRKQMEEAERRGTTPFADTKRGKGGVECGPAAAGDREPQNIPPLNSSPPASTLPLPSSSTEEGVVDWRWLRCTAYSVHCSTYTYRYCTDRTVPYAFAVWPFLPADSLLNPLAKCNWL